MHLYEMVSKMIMPHLKFYAPSISTKNFEIFHEILQVLKFEYVFKKVLKPLCSYLVSVIRKGCYTSKRIFNSVIVKKILGIHRGSALRTHLTISVIFGLVTKTCLRYEFK